MITKSTKERTAGSTGTYANQREWLCLTLSVGTSRIRTRGFTRESGQDHRYHDHRYPEHPATRRFFHLAVRQMLRKIVLALLLVCLHDSVNHALAQDLPGQDIVRVNTELLLFPIRIRDKKGREVLGLTDQDLILKDPDQATAGVYFSPEIGRAHV